jgi:hypothetical protein
MAISSLELPRIVLRTADPPSGGPPPYVGESESDDLGFFAETASDEDWARYNWWITAQAETRRCYNGLVAQSEGESFTTADVFTLKFSTFITDNLINYVVKSLKNQPARVLRRTCCLLFLLLLHQIILCWTYGPGVEG